MKYFIFKKRLNNLLYCLIIGLYSCQDPTELPVSNPFDPQSKYPIPSAPTELFIQSISETSVIIKWKDNSNIEIGYQIEKAVGDGPFFLLTQVVANENQYMETRLNKDSVYQYRIRGYATLRDGEYTKTIKIKYVPTFEKYWTTGGIINIKFSPNGSLLSWIRSLSFVSTINPSIMKTINYDFSSGYLSYSTDSKFICGINEYKESIIAIFDTSGNIKTEIDLGYLVGPMAVAFSDNDQNILVALKNFINKYRISDSKLLSSFTIPTPGIEFLYISYFSNNGLYFARNITSSNVIVIAVTDSTIALSLSGYGDIGPSLSFSDDNKYIYCGSKSGDIFCWRIADGKLLHTFHDNAGMITNISVSSDNKFLLSVNDKKTIRLWNINDESNTIIKTDNPYVDIGALSPDGSLIAVGGGYLVSLRTRSMVWKAEAF